VSYNKFLAKLASDHRKPDGLFVITPRMGAAFVAALAVGRFHGIGPKTAARMGALGIHTGADLRDRSLAVLTAQFGKAGGFYYGLARAEDDRPVNPDRQAKSLGAERTFERDLLRWEEVVPVVAALSERVWAGCARGGVVGRTVTVKVKYADFRLVTRSRSGPGTIGSRDELERVGLALLGGVFPPPLGVRLLGVAVSNLVEPGGGADRQLALGLG